jgi:hypothetical protein
LDPRSNRGAELFISKWNILYFSAYGFLRPLPGLLADIVEPVFPIAAIGAFICGFSRRVQPAGLRWDRLWPGIRAVLPLCYELVSAFIFAEVC